VIIGYNNCNDDDDESTWLHTFNTNTNDDIVIIMVITNTSNVIPSYFIEIIQSITACKQIIEAYTY